MRSFKIEFGSLVVQPFDFLELTFSMVTPGDVPPGAPAFNSFAYQANRADGLGSLATEPQKVGIALGSCEAASLGDFVWVDANLDGVQNDGPTGLNGVLVRLFAPGADGLPGTLDDVPLSATTGRTARRGGTASPVSLPATMWSSSCGRRHSISPPPTRVGTTVSTRTPTRPRPARR